MTMKWLTILQFLEIVAAYGIVTLFFRSCLWPVLQQRYPRNGTGIVQKLSGNGDFAGRKYLQKLS